MQKAYHKEGAIIPNSVDLSKFEALSKEKAERELGIKSQEIIILCVANLRPVKAIRYLIEEMNNVINEFPDVRLYLVGRDDQRGKLKRLAHEKNLQVEVFYWPCAP